MKSEQEIQERLENHKGRYDPIKHVVGRDEHIKLAGEIQTLQWVLDE